MGLIIALVTYGWGLYRQQKEAGKLLKFLEKFDSSECALETTDMPYDEGMLKPLTLLAKAFENTGEYHKSINIYLYLMKHVNYGSGDLELMERLGNTYLRAGFLERSRSIYMEILRRTPRNKNVLYELSIVHETMHNHTKAKEVLEPLHIMNDDTQVLENFIDFSAIVTSKKLDIPSKVEKLKEIYSKDTKLYRQAFIELLRLDTKKAWEIIDLERIEELIDVLWFLEPSQLDLDIIENHTQLRTLFYAKGHVTEPTVASDIFYLDMLATAKQSGFTKGDLRFSYLCTKCKQSFPVSFSRCPSCMATNSIKIEAYIAEESPKTDYSLL
jgi:lipopolysaccharide biosynthesis regulator YciM